MEGLVNNKRRGGSSHNEELGGMSAEPMGQQRVKRARQNKGAEENTLAFGMQQAPLAAEVQAELHRSRQEMVAVARERRELREAANELARERAQLMAERVAFQNDRHQLDAEREAVRTLRHGLLQQIAATAGASSSTSCASAFSSSSSAAAAPLGSSARASNAQQQRINPFQHQHQHQQFPFCGIPTIEGGAHASMFGLDGQQMGGFLGFQTQAAPPIDQRAIRGKEAASSSSSSVAVSKRSSRHSPTGVTMELV